MPIEPVGHVESEPPRTVHFCEHTGVGNWLNVFVQMPLSHSVLVSLTVVQSEPKAALPWSLPDPDPGASCCVLGASTVGELLLPQATTIELANRKALDMNES